MTQIQSGEEKARLKRQWTELAIKQAQSSQWEDAVITKKNLDRLALLQENPEQAHQGMGRIDPQLFIEETGKTKVTELVNLAPSSVLARVAVGDTVQLHVIGHTILVRNGDGEDIGQLEPRLANRLITFIEGGNRYAAAILTIEQDQVRLIVREEYQHPSMFGKV